MKNVSFLKMYSYSLLSISLWSILYIFTIYFTPRGHHIHEFKMHVLICLVVLFLSFLMTLIYKLFSLIKKLSSLKRDIIFILFISYLYLPVTIFSLYKEEFVPSIFSIEMVRILFNIKLYLLGVAVSPIPFVFVYLLRRRKNIAVWDITHSWL